MAQTGQASSTLMTLHPGLATNPTLMRKADLTNYVDLRSRDPADDHGRADLTQDFLQRIVGSAPAGAENRPMGG
jgi:hypothetical protein